LALNSALNICNTVETRVLAITLLPLKIES
jgi:hypothetical protein